MSGRVLIIQHDDKIPPGYLGEALVEAGMEMEVIHPYRGDPFPPVTGWDGIVSLGAHEGVYDRVHLAWINEEERFLAEAVHAGIPTLGICFGCQLLASALGGRAYRDELEVGLIDLATTTAGSADPVVQHLDVPVPAFHYDTWDPPPGAEVLASSSRYRHAFRYGSALGIQGHPEATPEVFKTWVAHEADNLVEAGVDASELVDAIEGAAPELREMASRVFRSWLAGVGS